MEAAMTHNDPYQAKFFTLFAGLAKMTGAEFDDMMIDLYVSSLHPEYSWEQLSKAILHIARERGSRDPFPSIKEIIKVMNPTSDPEAEAQEVAARIIEAVSKDGYTNHSRAKMRIGDLGWQVVEGFGGWRQLCETLTDKNVTSIRAQLRDLAKAKQVRALAGLAHTAPQIPHQATPKEQGQLRSFDEVMKLAHLHNPEKKK